MFQKLKMMLMIGILVAVTVGWSDVTFASPATSCPVETSEDRITEILTPDDNYIVIEGEQLDVFIENANKLYNIGWVRAQISKVYAIDAEFKHEGDFQAVHLFFIGTDGCIRWYQTTYAVVVRQLLDPDPMGKRGTEPVHPDDSFYVLEDSIQEAASTTPGKFVLSQVDPGGNIGTYIMWWERVAKTGLDVVIDGACLSACAYVLAMVPEERICMTERGLFGFHLASNDDGKTGDSDFTSLLHYAFYPKWVRDWLDTKEPLSLEKMTVAKQEDFKDHIKACSNG